MVNHTRFKTIFVSLLWAYLKKTAILHRRRCIITDCFFHWCQFIWKSNTFVDRIQHQLWVWSSPVTDMIDPWFIFFPQHFKRAVFLTLKYLNWCGRVCLFGSISFLSFLNCPLLLFWTMGGKKTCKYSFILCIKVLAPDDALIRDSFYPVNVFIF